MSDQHSHTHVHQIPGTDYPVTLTSSADEDTRMTLVAEVFGGRGRVTVTYEDDAEVTDATNELTIHLNDLIAAQARAVATQLLAELLG